MEQILITGVAGFIGSHVAKKFLDEGYYVIGIDDLSQGNPKNIPSNVDFIEYDLSKDNLNKILPKRCSKILHLAGQSSGEISFDNPIADLKKNTFSTLNLIQYGIEAKAERLIFASSMSVYGNVIDSGVNESLTPIPLSCYGVGKLAAEQYLRIYHNKLPYVSMRMFNVYGPGQDMMNLRQGMVSIYVSQAISKKEIIVKGGLNRFRDFIYIDDVVESWYRATFDNRAINHNINIATGVRTTVQEILNEICKQIPGSTFKVEGNTPGDQNGIYADISLMKEVLSFSPEIEINAGLNSFINWALLEN